MPDREAGVLSVDLGGTHTRLAIFTADGSMLHHTRFDTRPDDPASFSRSIAEIVSASPFSLTEAIVGIPAPMSYLEGKPLHVPHLPGWEPYLTEARLSEETGLQVRIGNDADLAALGEYRFGAGRGVRDMVYITASTGVGCGIIMGGKLLRGHYSLGEVGHMVIDWRSGETVEQVGSGTALGRLAGEPGENVTARAKAGDEKAIGLLRQVGKGLAVGVHDVVQCFMPERVVMGGGLLQAGDLVLTSIKDELAGCTKGCPVKGEDIVLAQGADDVGLLGGFAYWQELRAGE